MITLLKKLAIFRCRTRQTYVLLFLGVAFVFVSTIIGSFIYRTPPLPPRCSYITPYIGIFCSPYQTFRNGLQHYKFLEGRFYMKRELVTLGALTECVLLNFLYVSVFFCFVCLRCVRMLFTCRRSYKQLHTSGSVHIW